jgi:hypothetical protein
VHGKIRLYSRKRRGEGKGTLIKQNGSTHSSLNHFLNVGSLCLSAPTSRGAFLLALDLHHLRIMQKPQSAIKLAISAFRRQ